MIRRLYTLLCVAALVCTSSLPLVCGQEGGDDAPKVSKKTKGKEESDDLPAVPAALQGKEFIVPTKLNTKAKVYFIYQSRSTCGICVHEAPAIADIYKKMKGKSAELVMLNIDAKKESAQKWAKAAKMKFPIVAPGDGAGVPFPYSGGGLLPCMVAVDAEGNKLGEANGDKVVAFLQDWKKIVRDYEKEARAAAAEAKKKAKKGEKTEPEPEPEPEEA